MSVPQIPIQNLYYLLCYAWNRLEQGRLVDVSKIPSTELVDLFATVLIKGIDHLARRGLERGYHAHAEEIRGIRGRVDILSSARRFLLKHGRAACNFDELTANTLPNQIIRASLRLLVKDPNIDPVNRVAVLKLARSMRGVDDISLTTQCFQRIQLNGNNRFYRFLLNVCQLIHGAWLVGQAEGRHRFREFLRDEKKMPYVFQNFIYNFLRIERRDLKVYRENIRWKATSVDDPTLSLLPNMQTDISVTGPGRKIIIETKYYGETLSSYYESAKIKSEDLYQLVNYLSNSRHQEETIEGILLYPTVDTTLNVSYTILGIPIKIRTVDLGRPWATIHSELSQLISTAVNVTI